MAQSASKAAGPGSSRRYSPRSIFATFNESRSDKISSEFVFDIPDMLSYATTSRRTLLQSAGCGFGWLAWNALAAQKAHASPQGARLPHHTPAAKRIIFLFMQGGPSQVDTFDYKP